MKITRIKVQNISKQYRLGEIGTGTISHDINKFWSKLRGKENPYSIVGAENDRTISSEEKYVWVLKDLNFEVKEGEVLGIIGRNGAGKSTLLKLLSKVTGPTKGEIKINGRIGALLEVGTGMHPELTGLENIYLNGAILGMTKKEIQNKLESIIEFAGIAKYINTPFKRYSSGMRVRLGFAVAAFLEPEILIVDEVLAVGDAEFQKKAIVKMKEVSQGQGRAVLFVSHNMASIQALCTKGIVMDNGKIGFAGKIEDCINFYLKNDTDDTHEINFLNRAGNKNIVFTNFALLDKNNNKVSIFISGVYSKIRLYINSKEDYSDVVFSIGWFNLMGLFYSACKTDIIDMVYKVEKGENHIDFIFEKLPFASGTFSINILCSANNVKLDWIQNAFQIKIENGNYYGGSNLPASGRQGVLIDYKSELNA